MFKLLTRNFAQDKGYVLLNIVSLAVTISCCLILLSYILTELDYDKHFRDHERIYRIATSIQRSDSDSTSAYSARDLAPYLKAEYPQVIEDFVRFKSTPVSAYAHEELQRDWENVWFADDTVFSVFSHDVIYGNPETALAGPDSIAISESFSRFYFGDANPVGETLAAHGSTYEITLVYRDLPDNTHFKHNALLSANGEEEMLRTLESPSPGGIFGLNVFSYVKLYEGQSRPGFERQIADFYSRIESATLAEQANMRLAYRVQPLASIHYGTGTSGDLPTGNINNLYAFMAILIAMILVSSANYTNLSIARAIRNARQIGVAKILGAEGHRFSVRFLLETLCYAVIALILGLCAVEVIDTVTPIANVFGRTSLFDVTRNPELMLWSMAVVAAIALLASAYPAFYLSSVSPLAALNAESKAKTSRIPLQRCLLSMQLFISIAIFATTLLMAVQVNYLMDKPLGADYENLINVKLRGTEAVSSSPEMVEALQANAAIVHASTSSYVLGERPSGRPYRLENEAGGFDRGSVATIRVDSNFLETMGLELTNGRNFQASTLADGDSSAIVNAALVKQQGWENPVGKRLGFPIESFDEGDKIVVGVIDDFHVASLHEEIAPLILTRRSYEDFEMYSLDEGEMIRENLIVKYAGENPEQALALIESTLARIAPSYIFDYEFVADLVSDQYLSEVHQMALFSIFAGVSIFLSCLGIFGLISYALERRSRELSIRRVIGATLLQINNLLAKEYFYLLLIVAVPACLVSYIVIQDWLALFAYYTDVKIWIFGLAVAVVGLLSYSVVSLKLISLANSNLAEQLRYE